MATGLSVNMNAVAMLRNRRNLPWPSVTALAGTVLEAGAIGLTVHPRPDERHIRHHDVFDLAKLLAAPPWRGREFNIEGYPDGRLIDLVEEVRPDQVTLVPDDPAQSTSDHGWDIPANRDLLEPLIGRLKAGGMRVALFVDPDPAVAAHAAAVGADRIEIFTGPYGGCFDPAEQARRLDAIVATAEAARAAGLGLNAGHDLTLDNLPPLVARAPFIAEVSIGHALWADALSLGAAETVRRYVRAAGG